MEPDDGLMARHCTEVNGGGGDGGKEETGRYLEVDQSGQRKDRLNRLARNHTESQQLNAK